MIDISNIALVNRSVKNYLFIGKVRKKKKLIWNLEISSGKIRVVVMMKYIQSLSDSNLFIRYVFEQIQFNSARHFHELTWL